MTTAFPARKSEYEEDVIEISNFYGHKFYNYHKRFVAKAATLLQDKHIKVDWSKRDRDLLSLIGAGVEINICKLCNMIDNSTKFCPLQLSRTNRETVPNPTGQPLRNGNQNTDKRGRNRLFHNGKDICNNFNTPDGCISVAALSYTFAQNVVLPIMLITPAREALHRLAPLKVQRLILVVSPQNTVKQPSDDYQDLIFHSRPLL